ncbi:AraC family transcriptional activator of tynA and feaB [Variovorax sp. TBS-050B]|uniref:AraC family transcriptional regulator n=1 Tax=Variovorax sp. TBS-050B TaxID=2940551 RepID=UPI002475B9D4|nr:AraC family transcriptional regulator [Variovorax sp. TBS-050B]MDH6594895.1 AraC family transcriptional activator of tynA and feaB [Variovorax sp. TBS-050B]
MHQEATPHLSLAPHLRPFYPGDLRGYSSALDALVYPGELSVQHSRPRMSLEACRLVGGGIAISFDSTPMQVHHAAGQAAHDSAGEVLAMIAVDGQGSIEQAGRRLAFRKGDIVFRTTRLPSTCTLDASGRLVQLRLPAARFFGIYADLHERFQPALAPADSSLAESARHQLDRLFAVQAQPHPALAYFSEQSFVSLLAAVYCESTTGSAEPPERDRWQRLAACVEARLCDPELSVEAIARELCISKRLVHRLFAARQTQYGAYLRERRLVRARDELANARLAQLSVGEIAFRNGFGDPSHFSRAFRDRFGITPGGFRASNRCA